MAIEWDSFAHLAPDVLNALRDHGPLSTKEIAAELQVRGHKPHANAINKILTNYLSGQVVRVEKFRWAVPPPTNT